MSTTVKLKRGSGSDPSASDMVVGEPVIRTDTAELFFKKDDGSVAKVSGGGGGPDFKYLALRNAANNGSASYPGNDFTLVTSGTTTAISPAAANTLLVSYGGVIQKPNSGTSTSGITGFIVDGSRIKTATNFAAAPDFILYQESGGIGEPSDDTVTNAKVTSNAAIAGTKISPDFGSQNITTTGNLTTGHHLTISGTDPRIQFTDSNNNPDFNIWANAGLFQIDDATNSANRFKIASDGTVDVAGNLDVGAGLDVTGSLTVVQSASTNSAHIKMGTSTNQNIHLELENDGSADIRFGCFGSSANTFGNITANNGFINTTNDLSINSASDTGTVKIGIGATPSTKLLINSSGKVLIGTTDAGFSSTYTTVTIGNTTDTNTGLTIAAATNGYSRLHFADGNSGTAIYAGYIAYDHNNDEFQVGANNVGSNKWEFKSDGNFKITDGDLVIGTAGHGIDFSAATDVATGETVSSSVLDDYEEGTFTAGINNAYSSITYASQSGLYVKIGRIVHCSIAIAISSATAEGPGIRITGLPFTTHNNNYSSGGITYANFNSSFVDADPYISGNTTQVRFYKKGSGTEVTGASTNISSTKWLGVGITYQV